jgi:cytochrome P450
MEAKIAFSRLFQQYRISLPEDYELVPVQRFTVQVKDDIPCLVKTKE